MEERFDIHVVFRNKRAKQGLRGGIQLQTMKSCDFLFLAFLRILTVYYDILFHCKNQSGTLFFNRCSSVSDFMECNQATPSFADRCTKATESHPRATISSKSPCRTKIHKHNINLLIKVGCYNLHVRSDEDRILVCHTVLS